MGICFSDEYVEVDDVVYDDGYGRYDPYYHRGPAMPVQTTTVIQQPATQVVYEQPATQVVYAEQPGTTIVYG